MNNDKREGVFPATAMPDADWWEALWPNPDQTLADLGLSPGLRSAVDLCCGDGLFTAPLARLAEHVDALDLDAALLELARTRLATSAEGEKCVFIFGDAYDVAQLARRPADLVFMANTFHGAPDKTRLARAVANVLAPDGRFVLVNWRQLAREATPVLGLARGPATEMRMSPEETVAAVEPAGFRLLRAVALPPYHYGAVFAPTAQPE